MVLPVVHLAVRATEAPDLVDLLTSRRVTEATASTLVLAATVTSIAAALGVAMAWVLERTDVPAHRLLGIWAALPLVVPTYVLATAFKDAFGPGALLFELPGVVGFRGTATALALSTYPYVLLVARAALASVDPALEEAARSLGDGRRRAFARVTLPLVRPAVAAGGLLVFLYVLSDFGAVAILRYRTLTMAIFTEYRTSFDRSTPAAFGVVLVALTVVAVALERVARGRATVTRAVAGTRTPVRQRLGPMRWPVAIAVAAVPAVAVAVPAAVLVYRASLSTGRSEPAGVVARAAVTSVGLSLAAAAACVVLSIPISVLVARFRSRAAGVVEVSVVAGYALPGLVIALALVFFSSRYAPVVYQTATLVVAAYVVRFFPEALGASRSAVAAVDPALEDAARSLGDTRWRAVRRVTVPLVRRGLFAGGALVFLTAMKELPATLLLRPAGYDTLATRVWTGAVEGFYRQAAPSALLLLVVSAFALGPLVRGARQVSPS
ncbi:MAG TPA: iron ABC transporter permease [Acidimicrobiales bacterium]